MTVDPVRPRRASARPRHQTAAALVSVALIAAGCGDASPTGRGDAASAQSESAAAAARAYASGVAGITTRTDARLAALARRADYSSGARAAATTRGYARAVNETASALRGQRPPATVSAAHRALIGLYGSTAAELTRLAASFMTVDRGDRGALTARVQAFITTVSGFETREAALRSAIERGLLAS